MEPTSYHLPAGYLLKGLQYTYRIVRILGQGSFGITYLADLQLSGALGALNVHVAVKEFFMKELNGREGTTVTSGSKGGLFDKYRDRFAREAQNLAMLKDHPHIVNVLEAFAANNTVYYAMEYIDGCSLDDYITRRGALAEPETLRLVAQIGDALTYMHDHKMLHLDLKPGNIMLRSDGAAVLIDFGLSKQYDEQGVPESSTTIGGGTPGYAPIEQAQYHEGRGFPTTMDVYALGATMFKMLTGQRPPEAADILNEGFPAAALQQRGVSANVISCIDKAMSPMKVQRYQTLNDLLIALQNVDGMPAAEETTIDDVVIVKTANSCQVSLPSLSERSAKKSFTVNGVEFRMVTVEGGTFTMGATLEQQNSCHDEKPTHQVTLSTFSIGETPVTQALWKAVMRNNPSKYICDTHPVENVTWKECLSFIKILNSMTGMFFRLPTEAEWEYAARGGRHSKEFLYSGSDILVDVAWFYNNSIERTHSVATKHANELGIYDMCGNVWEWCSDYKGYYSTKSQTNPMGPSWGFFRINRGGSWSNKAECCRVSYRRGSDPTKADYNLGFRLAL